MALALPLEKHFREFSPLVRAREASLKGERLNPIDERLVDRMIVAHPDRNAILQIMDLLHRGTPSGSGLTRLGGSRVNAFPMQVVDPFEAAFGVPSSVRAFVNHGP